MVESVGIGLLVFNETLDIALHFCQGAQGWKELWRAQLSRTDVVRVNILAKNWVLHSLVVPFPLWWVVFQSIPKGIRRGWEFVVDKIEITELFDSRSVSFEWPYNIDGWMVSWIFNGKAEILSNFFQLSDVRWSVKNNPINLNLFIGLNFGLLMPSWLFNVFFFLNDLRRVGLWSSSVIDFAVYVDASDGVDIVWGWSWFFFLYFWLYWLVVGPFIDCWIDFLLRFDFVDNGWFLCFGWWVLGDGWGLSGWLDGLSWLGVLDRFWWLVVGSFGLLFCGLSFRGRSSSGYGFHTSSKKKIIHIFFKVSSFSSSIKSLFFILNRLIIIIDS